MLLLLAEDDSKIARLLISLLKKEGYQVDHAKDGSEALQYCSCNEYDVVILDWMMPVLDGVETCRKLRKDHYNGAVLMLTARDSLENKVTGLESGADDYLVKPFEYPELLARLKALARRSSIRLMDDIRTIADFSINRATRTVYKNNVAVDLSNREYQLFNFLFENAGHVIPRQVLIDRVWGIDSEITENNLDAHIRLLRKKVGNKDRGIIRTIKGIGYKMELMDV